jgi:hypothetical protein
MTDIFVRRLSLAFIIILALIGSVYYLYSVFYYMPTKAQQQVRPEIEIHFGGPPLQEKEK